MANNRHRRMISFALTVVSASFTLLAADAEKGAQVLQDTHCNLCHKVMGEGGALSARVDAPDLADPFTGRFTASAVAATLWTHTPAMWAAMNQEMVARPKMTGSEAEDLFAYLFSLQNADPTGDAKRGQDAFDRKGCSGCHAVVAADSVGGAPPVSRWHVGDPIALARHMWNHSVSMKNELAKNNRPWPSLRARDLNDIQAYVRQVQVGPSKAPSGKTRPAPFAYVDDMEGRSLYESQCRQCHVGALAPERRWVNKTFMDIAAGMWNHSPRMATPPILSDAEMTSILTYVWRTQYMGEPGRASRGREVFQRKHCATCHEDAGASRILRGSRVYTPFHLIALGWEHGTLMQQAMKQKGISWPALTESDVSDIVAFLNTPGVRLQ